MHRLRALIVLLAIMVLGGVVSQVAHADTAISRAVIIVLADRQALAEQEGGVDLARSFIGMVSGLKEGRYFVYMSADNPSEMIGPVKAGSPEFKSFVEQVNASLSAAPSGAADMSRALSRAYGFLHGERAKEGSSVFVLTGGEFDGDLARMSDAISLTTTLMAAARWQVHGLSLPGASGDTSKFLQRVTSATGGSMFELSVPSGLRSVADHLLRDEARGSLSNLGSGTLSSSEVFASILEIAPGTREANVLFFRETAYGSLRLSNPDGFDAADGDRTVSSVVDTPHVVVWKLIDPMPGQWKIDAQGAGGAVSAWRFTANKYSLGLASYSSLPVDEPVSLVAFVSDGKQHVVLEGVRVTARVVTPQGGVFSYDLRDNGQGGDSVAGDGYYSVSLPALGVEGDYRVDLTLSWIESGHSITSQTGFKGMHFPVIELTTLQTQDMKPGEKYKVAEAQVKVNDVPYPISVSELTAAVASNAQDSGKVEVVPQRLLNQGRAWAFDIYYTPAGEALHTVILGLDMDYAGRDFSYKTESIVVSSVLPVPPAQPEPVQPAPAPQPQAPALPEPSFPWGLLAIPGVLGVAVLAYGIYWAFRPSPYGYLYNDRNELVADFRRVRRGLLMRLLSKSAVSGKEVGAQGLERVVFKFGGGRVGLNTDQITPTIRVNNQPLIGETTIQDRTWIGAAGKLYSFFMSAPSAPQPGPAFGDDD